MAVEGVLVALDVGTSKVCALIGEIGRDGRLTVIGHGTVPSSGLKRGAVVNIEQTVRSIRDAVERAERLSGWKIDKAFVGVGGAQITSLNSKGQAVLVVSDGTVQALNFGIQGAGGETLTLALTPTGGSGSYFAVDNLSFDQVSVPEPSGAILAAAGLGALALRRRRK